MFICLIFEKKVDFEIFNFHFIFTFLFDIIIIVTFYSFNFQMSKALILTIKTVLVLVLKPRFKTTSLSDRGHWPKFYICGGF